MIPNGVIRLFRWHNPSGRTMALGLTQPLTEMSTRNISRGKRQLVRRADNLTAFMCRLFWNLGASTSWNPQGLSRPVMGLLYLYLYQNDKTDKGLFHLCVKQKVCLTDMDHQSEIPPLNFVVHRPTKFHWNSPTSVGGKKRQTSTHNLHIVCPFYSPC
jgi:hypothetical protein